MALRRLLHVYGLFSPCMVLKTLLMLSIAFTRPCLLRVSWAISENVSGTTSVRPTTVMFLVGQKSPFRSLKMLLPWKTSCL